MYAQAIIHSYIIPRLGDYLTVNQTLKSNKSIIDRERWINEYF